MSKRDQQQRQTDRQTNSVLSVITQNIMGIKAEPGGLQRTRVPPCARWKNNTLVRRVATETPQISLQMSMKPKWAFFRGVPLSLDSINCDHSSVRESLLMYEHERLNLNKTKQPGCSAANAQRLHTSPQSSKVFFFYPRQCLFWKTNSLAPCVYTHANRGCLGVFHHLLRFTFLVCLGPSHSAAKKVSTG